MSSCGTFLIELLLPYLQLYVGTDILYYPKLICPKKPREEYGNDLPRRQYLSSGLENDPPSISKAKSIRSGGSIFQ